MVESRSSSSTSSGVLANTVKGAECEKFSYLRATGQTQNITALLKLEMSRQALTRRRCMTFLLSVFALVGLSALLALRTKPTTKRLLLDQVCPFDADDVVVLFVPGDSYTSEVEFSKTERLIADFAEKERASVCSNDTRNSKCVRTSNWAGCLGRADVVLWDAAFLHARSEFFAYFEMMSAVRRYADSLLYSASRADVEAETLRYGLKRFSDLPRELAYELASASIRQVWVVMLHEAAGHEHYGNWVTNDHNARLFDFQHTLDWASELPFLPFPPLNASMPIIPFEERRKAVLHLVSNCYTPSERETFVAGLKRAFPVESVGSCGHNAEYPPIGRPPNVPESSSFDRFDRYWGVWKEWLSAHYLFDAAFANALCFGYVDEKLRSPLRAGSVPLVLSMPNTEDIDLAFGNKSTHPAVIHVDEFADPFELGEYLEVLSRNETAWNRFHEWRRLSQTVNVPRIPTAYARKREPEAQKCHWCDLFRVEQSRKRVLGEKYARRQSIAHTVCEGSWRQRQAARRSREASR